MRALLAKHGFFVVQDEDIATIAASLSSTLARKLKRLKHTHIAVAEKGKAS